jgi:DNA polymerase-3 subunit beta
MHVRVKRQYLIDALEHAMSDKVKIAMSEPDKATYITDTENSSFLYECAVMPVRV